jgi:hypothetical protein
MADPPQDDPAGVILLAGRRNYKQWAQAFQVLAQRANFWGLYTGEEKWKEYPSASYFYDKMQAAENCMMVRYWEQQQEFEILEYQEQRKRIKQAFDFLAATIEPFIRGGVYMYASPELSWNALLHQYDPPGRTPLQIANAKMTDLHLQYCQGMRDFLTQSFAIRAEIYRAGGFFNDQQLKLKILTSLTPEFSQLLVYDFQLQILTTITLETFAEYLLACEDQLPGHLIDLDENPTANVPESYPRH